MSGELEKGQESEDEISEEENKESDTEVVKKAKKVKKFKQKKLVMNIAQTKYHVVKYVGKKIF